MIQKWDQLHPVLTRNRYSVEKAFDKRVTNNKIVYYLKWEGYNDDTNSWEPEENLSCPK